MQGYTLTPNIKLQIFKVHIYKSMVKDFTTEYQEKPPFPQAQAQAAQVHVKDNSSTKAWLLSIKLWLLSIDGYMSISKSCSINQLSVISIYIGTIKTMQLSLGKMFSFSDTWFFTLDFMTLLWTWHLHLQHNPLPPELGLTGLTLWMILWCIVGSHTPFLIERMVIYIHEAGMKKG